jgi:hypothetical protein
MPAIIIEVLRLQPEFTSHAKVRIAATKNNLSLQKFIRYT